MSTAHSSPVVSPPISTIMAIAPILYSSMLLLMRSKDSLRRLSTYRNAAWHLLFVVCQRANNAQRSYYWCHVSLRAADLSQRISRPGQHLYPDHGAGCFPGRALLQYSVRHSPDEAADVSYRSSRADETGTLYSAGATAKVAGRDGTAGSDLQ